MRILLLSNRFPPDVEGGAELFAGDVVPALQRRGHDVQVLTARVASITALRDAGVQRELRRVVDASEKPNGSRRSGAGRALAFYRQTHSRLSATVVRRTIQRLSPDVVYVWNLSGIGLVSVLRALLHQNTPTVFHLHSYWWQYINSPQTRFSRVRASWLKRLLIGPVPPLRFSSFIAASDALKHEYVRVGCPEDRIEVIGCGIDPRLLRGEPPTSRSRRTPTVMYAGRLCAEKGVTVALEAIDVLVNGERRRVRFRVYGEGDPSYCDQMRDYVRERRLEDVVTFAGQVDRHELVGAYDSADVLVVPSLWEEPFGLVAVEAMARGVPVVASNVGGLRQVVRDGVDGYLVEPGAAGALAGAVERLLGSPSRREAMGRAGYHAVRERFDIEACVDRIEHHLKDATTLDLRECSYRR